MIPRILTISGLLLFCTGAGLMMSASLQADEAPPNAADSRTQADHVITLAIENEMLASDAVKSHRLRVTTEDGIVTLSGRVRNLLAQDIAVALAQRVRGVVSVVDQIEVNPIDRNDDELQQDIVAALAADAGTHTSKVTVSVKYGTARLTGHVSSHGIRVLVGNVVRGVVGVQGIDDQLATASNEPLSDNDLQQEIAELLKYAVQLDQIELETTVRDGNVVLTGTVTSDSQRTTAEQQAWRAGAKDVDVRGIHVDWRHANPDLRTNRYEKATDDLIRDAVTRALKYDPRVLSFEPTVTVDKGVVTLSGTVSNLAASKAAERSARFTVGVRRVENRLKVDWPDSTPTDEQIAEYTLQAIHRDPYLNGEEVIVNCENAHIELLGIVENEFEKEHAEWTASRQKAVVHVDNYLSVRAKWKPRSDEAITADLKDRLDLLFVNDEENSVEFKVTDGVAIVEGSVETWFLWQNVFDAVLQAGAREPHMMVDVRSGTAASLRYAGPHYYIPQ